MYGHQAHTKNPHRFEATLAGNQLVLLVDGDRVQQPNLADRRDQIGEVAEILPVPIPDLHLLDRDLHKPRTSHCATSNRASNSSRSAATSDSRKRNAPVPPGSFCATLRRPEAAHRATVRTDTPSRPAASELVRSLEVGTGQR